MGSSNSINMATTNSTTDTSLVDVVVPGLEDTSSVTNSTQQVSNSTSSLP